MPRPSTPKLPVSKTLLSEVMQRVSNAKTKAKKVEILQEYKSQALTKILLCNFSKCIEFCFPDGETPFRPLDRPKGVDHQTLFTEHRMLEKFIKKTINGVTWYGCSNQTRPMMQQLKKENLWIQILESLHEEEAYLLDLVKDKKLTSRYKITKQNVIDAFPELLLQNEE
jgi:hypothetical protein